MAKELFMKEWQEAYGEFIKLTPQGQRMLEPLIGKIYAILKKEAGNPQDLLGLYTENSKSVLKNAFPGVARSDLHSVELNLVERMAYWKRYTDIRPVRETPSEIKWARK